MVRVAKVGGGHCWGIIYVYIYIISQVQVYTYNAYISVSSCFLCCLTTHHSGSVLEWMGGEEKSAFLLAAVLTLILTIYSKVALVDLPDDEDEDEEDGSSGSGPGKDDDHVYDKEEAGGDGSGREGSIDGDVAVCDCKEDEEELAGFQLDSSSSPVAVGDEERINRDSTSP